LGFFLDPRLGRAVGLEVAADEAALLLQDLLQFGVAAGGAGVQLSVAERLVQQDAVCSVEARLKPAAAGAGDFVELDDLLAAVDAALEDERAGVDVAGADLHPKRHPALLPVVLLVAGARVAEVGDDPLLGAGVVEIALDAVAADALGVGAAGEARDEPVDEGAHLL